MKTLEVQFRYMLIGCIVGLGVCIQKTYKNPIMENGPDPWIIQHKGFYYYMCTRQDNLTIWKTQDPTDLAGGEEHLIYTPPSDGMFSKELWAPELHQINGSWYIYYAASDGDNVHHKLYVLENKNDVPTDGKFEFKGKLQTDKEDKWAIDMTAFENKGQWYAIWSAFKEEPPQDENTKKKDDGTFSVKNVTQQLMIAKMDTPFSFANQPVLISTPDHEWERITNEDQVYVNEGPEILKRGESLFLIYSASYCVTDNYTLGMIQANIDSDLLDPNSWKKSPNPAFVSLPEANAYGIGHNTFFKSPDGQQDWILYHGNKDSGLKCDIYRSSRAQPFTWNDDGTPNFGKPVPLNQSIEKPSGLSGTGDFKSPQGYGGKILFLAIIIAAFVYYFAFYRQRTKKTSGRTQ